MIPPLLAGDPVNARATFSGTFGTVPPAAPPALPGTTSSVEAGVLTGTVMPPHSPFRIRWGFVALALVAWALLSRER